MAILDTADIKEIKSLIHSNLTDDDLPDSFINQTPYLPRAELEIKKRLPTVESLTGDEETWSKIAAMNLTASLIAPAVGQRLQNRMDTQNVGNHATNWAEVDFVARAKALRAEYENAMAQILSTASAVVVTHFTLAQKTL